MSNKLKTVGIGKIRPAGWIGDQMKKDMDGFVGHLDQLAPALMIDDKIYGEHRLTAAVKAKSVGNIQDDDEWISQYLWWNSESQSNWWDGYVRHAFMLNDPVHLQKVESFIQYILSTQDEDGYLGIYAPDLRYQFTTENGELWSKATLFRVLLAYYEATGKENVLIAVTRAVQNVMDHYPLNVSTPFYALNSYSGVSHGLMFTDVLDKLFQITGKKIYLDYAVFLFRDFCRHEVSEKDVQLGNVLNEGYRHTGHGVHTYEHLRSLAIAALVTREPDLEKALSIYLQRIGRSLTPSGGPIGDEWIFERDAHPSDTGYEYCSIQELLDSYLFLLLKTGDPSFADTAEKIFFNAAQGARHPEHSSIAYLKTDNSYEMCGTRNGVMETNKNQTRYKYSPVHQDVAVCCSPNAGRITPYFVQHMWRLDDKGPVAVLYGPCEVELPFSNQIIRIKEHTAYPFDFSINIDLGCEEPVTFTLKLRRPCWVKKINLNVPFEEKDGFIHIHKQWQLNECVRLEFEPRIEVHQAGQDEVYFSYGPLVLAHPIESVETRTKEYGVKGMCDTQYRPVDRKERRYIEAAIERRGNELIFETRMLNMSTNLEENISLVPIGRTILRQVTFRKKGV